MIKTYLSVRIGNATFTFNGIRRDLTPGTDAAAHAAAALLRSAADALDAAMEPIDENGNRQCYLCGFFHDDPGSCANGTPTNITPGPDDEPEYTGPTDDDSDRFMVDPMDQFRDTDDDEDSDWASRGDTDPDSDDDDDDEDSDWDGPEDGDYSAGQIMPPPCKRVQEYRDGWDGPESGDYVEPREPDMPPLLMNLNIAAQSVADTVRERIGRSVVEASKRDEADQ